MIRIQIKGPKGIEKLSSLPENLQQTLLQGMLAGIELIITTSTKNYLSGPYPDKLTAPGGRLDLKKNLYGFAGISGVSGEFIHAVVGDHSRYAKVHEQTGRKISSFVITPKTKPYLHFFWEHKGIWMKLKYANIPARPFLWPAIMDNQEKIRAILSKCVREAYKKSAGGS